jgi:predicted nucleic acid-binding protein
LILIFLSAIKGQNKKIQQDFTSFPLNIPLPLPALLHMSYFTGDNSAEDAFWLNFFSKIIMLVFNQSSAMEGGKIYKDLKSKGLMIDIEDILIGAIAISNSLKLATDNINHFGRISGLQII